MAAGSGTSQVKGGPGGTSDRALVLAAVAKWGPTVDHIAKRYGISGSALLAKLAQGESAAISNPGAAKGKVSTAGAKGWTQFMPGSRAEAIKKFGVDPWRSPDEAFHAAALHLRGKINGSTGLEGYNPGMASYPQYILGQKVGDVSSHGGGGVATATGTTAAGGGAPAAAGGAAPGAFSPGGLRGTLAQAQPQQAPQIQGSLPQAPSFAAGPTLPQGYVAPPSGGGPLPPPEMQMPQPSDLTSPAQAGTGGPTASAAMSGDPGSSGQMVDSGGWPTGKSGKIIGTPGVGTHTLGNWQSDNAIDISVPVGTAMVALDDGVVVKVKRHPQGSGRFAGDQVTIRGKNGNSYFYAHGVAGVKAGQKVKAGQEIGTTGSANGVAHLHFGIEHGDPRKLVGKG